MNGVEVRVFLSSADLARKKVRLGGRLLLGEMGYLEVLRLLPDTYAGVSGATVVLRPVAG